MEVNYLLCYCREGKFMTYHKLTHYTTKATKYENFRAPCTTTSLYHHHSKNNKICQVPWNKNIKSMQNVNHTSAHVSNDVSNLIRVSNDTCHTSTCISNDIGACKRWHKWSNQLLKCVTLKIKIFQPIKWCHVSWRKSLKNSPIIL